MRNLPARPQVAKRFTVQLPVANSQAEIDQLQAQGVLITSTDPKPNLLSVVVSFLPWLLLAIPAGTLGDRVNRRTAMALANALRGLVLAVLAATVFHFGTVTIAEAKAALAAAGYPVR